MNEILKIRILLVEDNDDDVLLIREAILGTQYLKVSGICKDGEEALDYLRHEGKHPDMKKPDMIFLDINMPKKNGIEMLTELKSLPDLKHIPVVMLTTSNRDEDILSAYRAGACSFISKASEFSRFRQAMIDFEKYWTTISRLPRFY